MSFSYTPVSSNGVANAINGSMAAATNLIKMQHLIDTSREQRQDKLEQKMLLKQRRESNRSTLGLLTGDIDDSYYETAVGLDGDDDNTRAMAMWDRLNTEHGNNKDLAGFLDKYKNTTDYSGQGYGRFKRDMRNALLRATINAEEKTSGYSYIETVKDPDGGEPRQAKLFDITKYMAYKEGSNEPADVKFVEYMTKNNEEARKHLRATGDDYAKGLKQAADMGKQMGDLAKYSRSSASGGSAGIGANGQAYAISSPDIVGVNASSAWKESKPEIINAYEKQGVDINDKLLGRDKGKVYDFQYVNTSEHQKVVSEYGTAVLYGKLFKQMPKSKQDLIKAELAKGLNNDEKKSLPLMFTDDIEKEKELGAKLKEIINGEDPAVAKELMIGIKDAALPSTKVKKTGDGTGNVIKGQKATSWSNSGIQDEGVRKSLLTGVAKMASILDEQIALNESTAQDETTKVYGSQRLRDLKQQLLDAANPDVQDDVSIEPYLNNGVLDLTKLFGNRIE